MRSEAGLSIFQGRLAAGRLIVDGLTPPFRGFASAKIPEPADTHSDETLYPVRARRAAVVCMGSGPGPVRLSRNGVPL